MRGGFDKAEDPLKNAITSVGETVKEGLNYLSTALTNEE
jgi:hypothetical protein